MSVSFGDNPSLFPLAAYAYEDVMLHSAGTANLAFASTTALKPVSSRTGNLLQVQVHLRLARKQADGHEHHVVQKSRAILGVTASSRSQITAGYVGGITDALTRDRPPVRALERSTCRSSS
jgi:hypothetical protein